MEFLLGKIKDKRLEKIFGCINYDNEKEFKKIQEQFSEHDPAFLWLWCYQKEGASVIIKYIEANYKKFYQVLDNKILKKLCSTGNFETHMWEMILCDILSSSGELIPKEKSGADFHLKTKNGLLVQIEAIAPDESKDKSLRAIRPDYSTNKIFELMGNIEDIERPILLRVLNGINAKESKYRKDIPLIIAINSSKTVGLVSRDEYILHRILFGLGFETITKQLDGSHKYGFQQNPLLNKPGEKSFPIAIFRDPDYKHVSGIIYTSQRAQDLVPGGNGWFNHGITYVPNPQANFKPDIMFPYFRRMVCTEESYQEIPSSQEFKSLVPLG